MTIYNCFKIYSSMTGNSTYFLFDDIEKEKEIISGFRNALELSQFEYEALGEWFEKYINGDIDGVIAFDDYTDVVEISKINSAKGVLLINKSQSYYGEIPYYLIHEDVHRLSERF